MYQTRSRMQSRGSDSKAPRIIPTHQMITYTLMETENVSPTPPVLGAKQKSYFTGEKSLSYPSYKWWEPNLTQKSHLQETCRPHLKQRVIAAISLIHEHFLSDSSAWWAFEAFSKLISSSSLLHFLFCCSSTTTKPLSVCKADGWV